MNVDRHGRGGSGQARDGDGDGDHRVRGSAGEPHGTRDAASSDGAELREDVRDEECHKADLAVGKLHYLSERARANLGSRVRARAPMHAGR